VYGVVRIMIKHHPDLPAVAVAGIELAWLGLGPSSN
jgi:hypothetical protein